MAKKISCESTKHWMKTTKIAFAKMQEIRCFKSQWVQSFRSEQSKKFTKLRNSFSNSAKNIFCAIFPIYAKMFLCQCTKTKRTSTQKKETFSKDLCLHLRFVFKHWQRMKTKWAKNVFRASEEVFKRYLGKLFALFKILSAKSAH